MFVSVIIPTYKRTKDLKRVLDSLCLQTILPNETIIVDQSPDKDTKVVCTQEKYQKIGMRYFWKDDASSARARNQGIGELNDDSNIVCFFDDDVEIDKCYIQEVIHFFKAHPQALGGGGYKENIEKSSLITLF
jgi:GT2 family glycosyltransferase